MLEVAAASPRGEPSGTAAVPEIRFRPGVYANGRRAVAMILDAALQLLVREGFRAITFRRIAEVCDVRTGNVTYYFASKEDLFRALLDTVIQSYTAALVDLQSRTGETPEARFALLLRIILEDVQSETTTKLFSELWTLSNHDPDVAARLEDMYRRGRRILVELIAQLNPALDAESCEDLAVFVQAATEGATVFAGFRKPFEPRMPWFEAIAIHGLTHIVKSASARQPLSALAVAT